MRAFLAIALGAFLTPAALTAPIRAAPAPVVVETAHYRLEAETSRAEAEEMGRILEASWTEFRAFFGAVPDLAEGEKLRVFFGGDRASFAARLREDGAAVPRSGGYYSPGTRTGYLWRQPTICYTRSLLIHEVSHQFHYLSRTKNKHLGMEWYVEGLAEHLSRHQWDGETLRLGVIPTLSLEDFPAAALERLRKEKGAVSALVMGKMNDRALGWALVRFLLHADDGKWSKKFAALRRKLDRGGSSASLFPRTIGSPGRIEKALMSWLAKAQEPWRQIFNQWEGIGPGRFSGTAPTPIVTACSVKGGAVRLAATLEIPPKGPWIGGLLLHHQDRDRYTTAMAYGGKELRVLTRRGGRWISLLSTPCPAPEDGLLKFAAVRGKDRVTLTVGGREIGTFQLPGPHLGLALQGCTLRYRDVTWDQ